MHGFLLFSIFTCLILRIDTGDFYLFRFRLLVTPYRYGRFPSFSFSPARFPVSIRAISIFFYFHLLDSPYRYGRFLSFSFSPARSSVSIRAISIFFVFACIQLAGGTKIAKQSATKNGPRNGARNTSRYFATLLAFRLFMQLFLCPDGPYRSAVPTR